MSCNIFTIFYLHIYVLITLLAVLLSQMLNTYLSLLILLLQCIRNFCVFTNTHVYSRTHNVYCVFTNTQFQTWCIGNFVKFVCLFILWVTNMFILCNYITSYPPLSISFDVS